MIIELRERTEQHVRIYFERVQDPKIRKNLPQTVTTLEQALSNYANTQKPNAASYGATIYVDGTYVGDVWCYGIDLNETPQAMVSYCIFEKAYWGKGIMSHALELFLTELTARYHISCTGAFAFSANRASIRVLEKNGFEIKETFRDNEIESVYLQAGDCHASLRTGAQ